MSCERACVDIARDGLGVVLRDARTGTGICDGEVVAADGRRTERLRRDNLKCGFYGLTNAPGEYEVFVTGVGYLPQTIHSVEVHADECGLPDGKILYVDLEPDPNAPPRDAGTD